ncbi:DUF2723 domain-containing protein, partial [Myxococcota bacterium]|nr:DUF2723 domain-containing protein [Myxococcota bacterium]
MASPSPAPVEGAAPEPPARAVLVASFLVVLGVYVRTLHPSIPGGDGGELVLAAHHLGVAHPPGYPLFTLLGKLFTLLPIGTIAWRVNLMSAVMMASAVALLAATILRATRSAAAAVLGAGLFAFSGRTWVMATGAEVFALNALFVAALLALALDVALTDDDARRERTARAGALVLGLGLTNHHTLVFVGLPLVAWVLVKVPALRAPKRLAVLAALFTLGLTPYVYLPLASLAPNVATWGDQSTLDGFLRHFLRQEYGTFRLGGEAFDATSSFGAATIAFGRDLVLETLGVGLVLASGGLGGALGRATPATREARGAGPTTRAASRRAK